MADGVHRTLAYRAGSPDARPGAGTIRRAVRAGSPASGAQTVDATVDRVLARMTGLGPLEPLLTDPAVTDVMVNGPGRVWLERDGTLVPTGVVLDRPTIEHLIERVVGPLGLRADRATPMVDARMPDGSRVHVVMPPIAVDGPCVTIRRFATRPRALAEMCPPAVAFLLGWAVRNRLNMMVSGGTGAGKTTLLNALAAEIPTTERIVTVEEAAELRLAHHHVVRLEARPSTPEAGPPVTIRDLVRNALRMRPDRIIVGECRGPEALEVLVAANSGHEGTLSTCHANSPIDALRRLETMVLLAGIDLPLPAVRDQIVAALDLVVQVARRSDGTRRVVAVAEVTGAAGIDAEVAGRRPASSCRLLADDSGVHSVPQRPVRAAETEPLDTAWVTP
ncbi:MAG: CpaF family protein [Acidimicrobiales bacterium]